MDIDHEKVIQEAHKRASLTQYYANDHDRKEYLALVAQFTEDIIDELQEAQKE